MVIQPRHEHGPYMSSCGELSKVYIKLSSFSLSGSEKKPALVLNDARRMRGKLETLIWKAVATCWRNLGEFRISFSLKVENKPSKTINRARVWYPQVCITALTKTFFFFFSQQRRCYNWKLGLEIGDREKSNKINRLPTNREVFCFLGQGYFPCCPQGRYSFY